jgi:aminopeptidase
VAVVASRMLHPIHERYADLLIGYCTAVEAGDVVALHVGSDALPMARALTRAVLRAGARPLLRIAYPQYEADLVALASDAYFDAEPIVELEEMRRTDAFVRVDAPSDLRALQHADKGRMARLARHREPVQRQRLAHTRWVGTLYPTLAAAVAAGMGLDEFEAFVFGAMYLDEADPVASWRELRDLQGSLIARLSRARTLRVLADGTDLSLSVAGRTWVNSDGRRNMPSGEVFTGPLEDSAEGTVVFDLPSSLGGALVTGVRLRFEAGVVVEAAAEQGEDLLLAQLDADAGARRLGEVGIGTNTKIQRPILHTLFDEKIGGTLHLALGRSYAETGGTNQSSIHWDLITDLRRGGRIELDGEPFQVDGRFV